ncbi:MAG: hypothetical protein ABJN40_20135 [Sneathiella sp.]
MLSLPLTKNNIMGIAPLKSEKGFVLVSVLWVIALISLISLSISSSVQNNAKITRNYLNSVQAEHIANAGAQIAIYKLLNRRRNENTGFHKQIVTYHGSQIEMEIIDEAGKIDLNSASTTLLEKLFISSGASRERSLALIDTLLDWRDKDSTARPNGAEHTSYSSNHTASIKNSKLEYKEELAHILGISSKLYQKLSPHITVLSNKRGVDPSNSSRKTLEILVSDATNLEEISLTNNNQSNFREIQSKLMKLGISRRLMGSPTRSAYTITVAAKTASEVVFERQILSRLDRTSYALHSWAAN